MSTAISKTVVIDIDEDQANNTVSHSATDVVIDEDGKGNGLDIIDEDADGDAKLPKRARPNADGSVTLPLVEAVTLVTRKDGKVRDRVFTELVFYRLKGADIRAIQSTSDEKSTLVTFARSTRIPQMVMDSLFDKLDGSDISDAGQIIKSFLTSGPKTGQ